MTDRSSFRCVHLSSAHPADNPRVFLKECESIAAAGYETHLVARKAMSGKSADELSDQVRVHIVKERNGRLRRMTQTIAEVRILALKLNADLYHFHDPELIPLGIELSFRGKPVIYDVHEDVPGTIMGKKWIPSLMRPPVSIFAKAIHKLAASRFRGIVTAWPAINGAFPSHKTVAVQNFPLENEIAALSVNTYDERDDYVAYVGHLTEDRSIREMVQAMSLLPEHSHISLKLGGDYRPKELRKELESLPGWERIEYLGWLSRRELTKVFSGAKVGLLIRKGTDNYVHCLPHKMFEYMAAGVPIVASDFPLWRSMVKETGCGLVVDPSSPVEIAKAISWLFDHPEEAEQMGKRGRKLVIEHYNWSEEAESLVSLYDRILLMKE